jgi:hypothetical protein
MAVIKNKTSDANREYWSHVEEVAREVGKWPHWMNKSTEPSINEEAAGKLRVRAAKVGGNSVSDNK